MLLRKRASFDIGFKFKWPRALICLILSALLIKGIFRAAESAAVKKSLAVTGAVPGKNSASIDVLVKNTTIVQYLALPKILNFF